MVNPDSLEIRQIDGRGISRLKAREDYKETSLETVRDDKNFHTRKTKKNRYKESLKIPIQPGRKLG